MAVLTTAHCNFTLLIFVGINLVGRLRREATHPNLSSMENIRRKGSWAVAEIACVARPRDVSTSGDASEDPYLDRGTSSLDTKPCSPLLEEGTYASRRQGMDRDIHSGLCAGGVVRLFFTTSALNTLISWSCSTSRKRSN